MFTVRKADSSKMNLISMNQPGHLTEEIMCLYIQCKMGWKIVMNIIKDL